MKKQFLQMDRRVRRDLEKLKVLNPRATMGKEGDIIFLDSPQEAGTVRAILTSLYPFREPTFKFQAKGETEWVHIKEYLLEQGPKYKCESFITDFEKRLLTWTPSRNIVEIFEELQNML